MSERLKDYAEAAANVLFLVGAIALVFVPMVIGALLFGAAGGFYGLVGTLAVGLLAIAFDSALRHVRRNGRDLFR